MTRLSRIAANTIAGAGMLLGGAGFAHAALTAHTAAETLPFGVSQSTNPRGDALGTQVLTFAGFNGGLGTLVSVDVTMATGSDTNGLVTISLTGGEGTGQVVDQAFVGRQTNMSATGPSGLAFSGALGGDTSCSADTTGSCGNSAAMGVSTSQDGTQSVIAPNLAPFMFSTFDMTVTLSPFFDNSADAVDCFVSDVAGNHPSCLGTASAFWQGELSVVYNYSPVVVTEAPEPASMALLAGGLGALGLLRRRRR